MKLFVKICGITRIQDAEVAAGLGASALGFVLWPGSPRYLAPEAVKNIAGVVPPGVAKVGVFVDQPLDDVVSAMEVAGLDVAQLHGSESVAYCRDLAVRVPRIIKSVAIGNGSPDVAGFDPDITLLVDAYDAGRRGGTGKTVNWDSAREIAAARRTILAGGLNAANVKLAVRSVRPYGVDVSSGVESSPGIKDPSRLRSFFEALHE